MHGSLDNLGMGFGFGGMGLIFWIVVALAVIALIKYLLSDNRR